MTPLQKSILNAVKRRPMTLRELQNTLQVDNSRLRTTVSAMVATGELSMRNGTYVPGFATYENAAAPNTIPCTLVKLAARFGFASRDDGEGDIFIPGRALHGAMPNDKINVKLFDHPRVEGSSEGEVVEVLVDRPGLGAGGASPLAARTGRLPLKTTDMETVYDLGQKMIAALAREKVAVGMDGGREA